MPPQINTARTADGTTRAKGLQLEEVVKLRSTYKPERCRVDPSVEHCGHQQCWRKVMYRVEVDVMKLHAMARKAAGSKGGKAVDGPVVVTVVEG